MAEPDLRFYLLAVTSYVASFYPRTRGPSNRDRITDGEFEKPYSGNNPVCKMIVCSIRWIG